MSFVHKLSGWSIHFKAEFWNSWKETSLPAGVGRDDGDYILKGMQPDTVYYIYVTAINNYGHGDPSELLTIKTRSLGDASSNMFSGGIFSSSENIALIDFQQQMLSFVSITVAIVVVIIVVIISYVCIKKAQLDASKPPLLMAGPRPGLDIDKAGVYVGTTHRYVDFDQRPLMQGNMMIDAQGNMYPAAQFATLAAGTSSQQHHEEMKSFVPHHTPVSVSVYRVYHDRWPVIQPLV